MSKKLLISLMFIMSIFPCFFYSYNIVLEPEKDFYYINEAINIRFILSSENNTADEKIDISSISINDMALMADSQEVKKNNGISSVFQPVPDILKPGTQIIQTLDLKKIFSIDHTGKYILIYRNTELEFDIIPDYNPDLDYIAIIRTDFGDIKVKFFKKTAPGTVKNFIDLANRGFYNNLTFHRVIPGFVIQGGCPNGDGTGGPGYTIDAEISDTKHLRGSLSMARGDDINSAGSQFFICLEDLPRLDFRYTVFGQVFEGMEAVDKISSVKTTGHEKEPYDSPLEPVYIRKIVIDDSEQGNALSEK